MKYGIEVNADEAQVTNIVPKCECI